jgi:hypothetical protein
LAIDQAPLPRPWQASIHAELSRVTGIDVLEEIVYENGGRFTRRTRPFGTRPGFGSAEILSGDQLVQLLTDLRAEQQATPAGVDLLGLEVFTDLIEDALRADPPSSRFDHARFGAITKDETRHVLLGHVGLGVDVAGTVRDVDHELSFEQHVVIREPGPFRPLSAADQASLARALTAAPPADPNWQQVLQDAAGHSADVAERYVRQHYPRFVAAGGRIAAVASPAAGLLPSIDVFSFAVGSKYPISTSPQARHTILVDRGERTVVLDLDSAAPDATVAANLHGANLLPQANLSSAPAIAQFVAVLAPLDPFFSNPSEGGGFVATATADGGVLADWSGDKFRYVVDFQPDGTIANLLREDQRIKPI